jgi:hypothetical protein
VNLHQYSFLKKILDEGTFPLQAREVQAFIVVYKFVDELGGKIEKAMDLEEELKVLKAPKPKATKKKSSKK